MPAELAGFLAATEDDRLEQAEALVRSHCGWHIARSRTEMVTLDASGSAVQVLPSLHVTAVASVTDNGVLIDPADYHWSEAGVLTRVGGWWGARKIVVEMTHGYDVIPLEVTGIVQAVAQRAFDNPGSRPREQGGPFSDTYSQSGLNQAPALALLDAEKATLARYKLPPRP